MKFSEFKKNELSDLNLLSNKGGAILIIYEVLDYIWEKTKQAAYNKYKTNGPYNRSIF